MGRSGCSCSNDGEIGLTHIGSTKSKPKPGDLGICAECGGLFRFDESLKRIPIDEPPGDMSPETRAELLCAQAYVRGQSDGRRLLPTPCPRCAYELDPTRAQGYDGRIPRPGDFAQCPRCLTLLTFGDEPGLTPADRDRLEIEADAQRKEIDPDSLQEYERSIAMTRMVVRRYMRDFPNDPPLFALGPREIGILARLSQLGDVICKDSGSRAIVAVLRLLSAQFQNCPEPTYLILLGVLLAEGIPFESVSLADLGIVDQDRRPS